MSVDPQEISQELIDNFELFDAWEDRYRYIIELGNTLDPLEDHHRVEQNRVQGCVSNVWLIPETTDEDQKIWFRADSNSQLVKGLIAIVLKVYSGRTAKEIVQFDIDDLFKLLNLRQHISQSRSNGLSSMVQRLKSLAVEQLAASSANIDKSAGETAS